MSPLSASTYAYRAFSRAFGKSSLFFGLEYPSAPNANTAQIPIHIREFIVHLTTPTISPPRPTILPRSPARDEPHQSLPIPRHLPKKNAAQNKIARHSPR